MSETMIERDARLQQEWEARKRNIKRDLANYQKQLKEPIYREGFVEREDGTVEPELLEVNRRGVKIGEWPALWDRKDGTEVYGGLCIALIVHEGIRAEDEGWGGTKIHTLYFDRQGKLDHVMILDYAYIRHSHEMRYTDEASEAGSSMLEKMGVVTTSLPS